MDKVIVYNGRMVRPRQNKPRSNVQVWLVGEDSRRYEEMIDRALRRQPRARVSDINRRLLGLDCGEDLLTDADLLYFQGRSAEAPPQNNGRETMDGAAPAREIEVSERATPSRKRRRK